MADEDRSNFPDPASDDDGEGSREAVKPAPARVDEGLGATNPMERGSGQRSRPERPLPEHGSRTSEGTGITNRPRSEEDENQERVPPRGNRKDDSDS